MSIERRLSGWHYQYVSDHFRERAFISANVQAGQVVIYDTVKQQWLMLDPEGMNEQINAEYDRKGYVYIGTVLYDAQGDESNPAYADLAVRRDRKPDYLRA